MLQASPSSFLPNIHSGGPTKNSINQVWAKIGSNFFEALAIGVFMTLYDQRQHGILLDVLNMAQNWPRTSLLCTHDASFSPKSLFSTFDFGGHLKLFKYCQQGTH